MYYKRNSVDAVFHISFELGEGYKKFTPNHYEKEIAELENKRFVAMKSAVKELS